MIFSPSERETKVEELLEQFGFVLIPPYDNADIVAGQGTVGLEIMSDLDHVDVILVPVSGGGLIGGVATAVKTLSPETLVIGVEPELAGDTADSFHTGTRVTWSTDQTYRTIADRLRTSPVGAIPWRQIQAYVDDVITVSEDEICETMRVLSNEEGIRVEPAGAVSIAGYLFHSEQIPKRGTTVGVVSGGNVSDELFSQIMKQVPVEELVVR